MSNKQNWNSLHCFSFILSGMNGWSEDRLQTSVYPFTTFLPSSILGQLHCSIFSLVGMQYPALTWHIRFHSRLSGRTFMEGMAKKRESQRKKKRERKKREGPHWPYKGWWDPWGINFGVVRCYSIPLFLSGFRFHSLLSIRLSSYSLGTPSHPLDFPSPSLSLSLVRSFSLTKAVPDVVFLTPACHF